MSTDLQNYPFKKLTFMPRDVELDRRADGTMILRSRIPMAPYEPHIPAYLRKWSEAEPDRVWLAQRRGADRAWLKVTYGEAQRIVDSVTQALIDMKLPAGRPVAILSGNSLEHAFFTMAAMQACLPVAPVSPAYSLMSADFAKLKYVFELLEPSLVFVQNGPMFAKALAALDLKGARLVHVDAPPPGMDSTPWQQLITVAPTAAVAASVAAIRPDTIGKFLLTSGSTGMPKAVINTQRMMSANVAISRQARQRGSEDPVPVVLDWLPWNHTMGGNASFYNLLAEGGTMYLDDGRPLPGQFDETLRNLREISPTSFTNVPAGYAMLATALEHDEALCRTFFENLSALAYGGATLPDDLYLRMQRLAVRYTGHRIVFFTGWGSTETAPNATITHWATERVGLIGLPLAGVELKLIPTGPKYEVRIRAITVTPGYYKRADLTAAAFDEEGFYRIGDAAVFVDPDDVTQGLIFAGRVVEDFKLMSGTFVHVGSLRVAAIAAASPAIQDAVVAGQDREYIGLLAWPNLPACRQLMGKPDATPGEVVAAPAVIELVRRSLAEHNRANPGSSMSIERVVLMSEPPSIDGHELTDKGYINQRATLDRRGALVERLYAEPPGGDVIVIG